MIKEKDFNYLQNKFEEKKNYLESLKKKKNSLIEKILTAKVELNCKNFRIKEKKGEFIDLLKRKEEIELSVNN